MIHHQVDDERVGNVDGLCTTAVINVFLGTFVAGDSVHMRPDRDHPDDNGAGEHRLADGCWLEARTLHALHRGASAQAAAL